MKKFFYYIFLLFIFFSFSLSSIYAQENWILTTTINAPTPRVWHTAVSTGNKMIVWGGYNYTSPYYMNSGAIYDTATNSWTATPFTNAPVARDYPSSIWTGTKMIIWGGYNNSYLNSGGIYDTATNTWAATSTINAPQACYYHTAIWTGIKMIIWGGAGNGLFNTGGIYNPATDTWTATSTTNAPVGRCNHTAVWTGSKMIVWGGYGGSVLNTGGIYDPSTDTWTAISTTNAPTARRYHSAIWTGSKMVIWGGNNGGALINTGGVYDPESDTWTATSTVNAHPATESFTTIWTGTKMIVWGGNTWAGFLNSGKIYNVIADTWTSISTTGAPEARYLHTAVWTGSKMIVWGGWNGSSHINTGGLYFNPVVIPPPSAPTLNSPSNGAVNVSVIPTMIWNSSTGASSYRIQISTDSTFAAINFDSANVPGTTISVPSGKLTNNILYYWRVTASNGGGASNYSNLWNFTTIVPIPTAPSLLIPANNSIGNPLNLNLVWNKPQYASGYNVIIATDTGFTNVVMNDTTLTDSVKVLTNLSVLTKYYWKVRAKNIAGWGIFSSTYYFKTVGAPSIVVLASPLNNSVNLPLAFSLCWFKSIDQTLLTNKKSNNNKKGNSPLAVTNYWFEYGTDSTFATVLTRDSLLTDTVKSLSGLNYITKYFWRVKAKNQTGWGNFSNVWNFTTIVPIPVSPIIISPATGSIDISLTPALDWSDVTYVSNYRVQVSVDSLFGTTAIDSTGIIVSNINIPSGKLTTLTKYYWRINASNIAGTGAWSTIWNFTTIPNAPNPPVLISPSNGTTGQPVNLTFVWRKAIETILTIPNISKNNNNQIPFNNDVLTLNKYWLEYTSTDSTFVTGVIRDSSATDTLKSVTLTYNTKYWWRVKGKNQTGWGSFSTVWSFTTMFPVPVAPTLLLPANNATGVSLTPLLDWNDVTYATSYRIQVSSDSTFSTTAFDTTGVTSSQLTVPAGKLTGLTRYYWRIYASNTSGSGPWSSICNFRTLQNLTLNLKVYLEGFWDGVQQVTDTVRIYLAGGTSPYTLVDSITVLISATGTAVLTFIKAPNANYYIVVRHRNHLETWSKLPQAFITNVSVNYDFTTAANKAYGDNMKQVGSVWVLIVGDENQDGSIDAADAYDFINQYGNIGYFSCDFNGDLSVDAADVPLLITNYGLTKVVPTLEILPPDLRKQNQIIKKIEMGNTFIMKKNNNLIKSE